MAYCELNDVYLTGVHGGRTYTDDSTPNIEQVEDAIDKIAREMDSRFFAAGITVPISETDSPYAYAIARDINALGAAWLAESSAWSEQTTSDPDDDRSTPGKYKRMYRNKLDEYTDYPIRLRDAVLSEKHRVLYTAEDAPPKSVLTEIYDFSHIDEKEAESLSPAFRMDDEF